MTTDQTTDQTTTTANGSPIVPVGTLVRILDVYPGRGHRERQATTGRIGRTVNMPDGDGDVIVNRVNNDPAWGNGYHSTYARRWERADQPADQPEKKDGEPGTSTSEETTPEQEATALAEYTALANAAVQVAADQDWCSEFEDVMRAAGFFEVACTRVRQWSLRLGFDYDLDNDQAADAIGHVFTTATPVVVEARTTIQVEAVVPWTGHDPDTLTDGQLADLLHQAGYDGFDDASVSLDDKEDDFDADKIQAVAPKLGGAGTWVARREAFVDLLVGQARSRKWGEHLAAVYEAAGIERPRAQKISVQTVARRSVYRRDAGTLGAALQAEHERTGGASADYLVAHKNLHFEVDNPYTDNECHCSERDERRATSASPALLAEPMRTAVVLGAKATLADLMGDEHTGWHGNDVDVTLTCIYCS